MKQKTNEHIFVILTCVNNDTLKLLVFYLGQFLRPILPLQSSGCGGARGVVRRRYGAWDGERRRFFVLLHRRQPTVNRSGWLMPYQLQSRRKRGPYQNQSRL